MPLFAGVGIHEIGPLLTCLKARVREYQKNQIIFAAGQPVSSVGIVLSGGVYILKEDIMGNRSILTELGKGDLFAEAFCCARVEQLPVTALSVSKSDVLLIDYGRILSTCPNSAPFMPADRKYALYPGPQKTSC
jgi:signal-transduction protein with cAMP-binding, CBS, and nucleotidyltransferase domain